MKSIEPAQEAAGPAAGPVYRDDSAAIQQELARQRARHQAAIEGLLVPLVPVYAARAGRIAAGTVLLTGAVLMVLHAVFSLSPGDTGWLTALLVSAWPAAWLARRVVRAGAGRHLAWRLGAPLAATGDAHGDLARLRRLDMDRHAARVLASAAWQSMALPLAGVALLLPLTLHFLVAQMLGISSYAYGLWPAFVDFDEWVVVSMILVGHSHILLAVLAWRFGKRLSAPPAYQPPAGSSRAGWRAYGFTVLSSVLPGGILFVVPVVIVAVTGLFVPLLFAWAEGVVNREHAAVELTMLPIVAPPRAAP